MQMGMYRNGRLNYDRRDGMPAEAMGMEPALRGCRSANQNPGCNPDADFYFSCRIHDFDYLIDDILFSDHS